MMNSDRFRTALAAIVRSLFPQMDYQALYPCRVDIQNADGTLELTPESPDVAKQKNVPIRMGLPGVTAKVASGARVMLGWENADARRPFAALWGGPNETLELHLDAGSIILNGGETPVAMEGSATMGHTHTFSGSVSGATCSGTTESAVDHIDSGEGSPTVLVP